MTGYESKTMKDAHVESVMILSEPFRENKIGEYTRELVDMLPTLERNDYLKKSHQYQDNDKLKVIWDLLKDIKNTGSLLLL